MSSGHLLAPPLLAAVGTNCAAVRLCRTGPLTLARGARVGLSMTETWRAREDSNLRPSGPQPDALSAELRARVRALAEREGFEPSEEETPFNGLANRRTRPLCDLSASGADDSMAPSERRPRGPVPTPVAGPH